MTTIFHDFAVVNDTAPDLKVGDQVHYQPRHYLCTEFDNGIVKEIPTHTQTAVRVVYNCTGNWHKYSDYTSVLTKLIDLKPGWKDKEASNEPTN